MVIQHALSKDVRADFPRQISISEIQFTRFPLGIHLEDESDQIFTVIDDPLRILPYNNTFQNAVTFEISENKKILTRVDYGVLDWLSDIGGLYKILQMGVLMLVLMMNEHGPTLFVTTSLIKRKKDQEVQRRDFAVRSKQLNKSKNYYSAMDIKTHFCLFLRLRLADKCKCLRVKKKDRFLLEVHKNIEPQFDISMFFRKLNVFEGVIRSQMSSKKWREACQEHSLYSVRNNGTIINLALAGNDLESSFRSEDLSASMVSDRK